MVARWRGRRDLDIGLPERHAGCMRRLGKGEARRQLGELSSRHVRAHQGELLADTVRE